MERARWVPRADGICLEKTVLYLVQITIPPSRVVCCANVYHNVYKHYFESYSFEDPLSFVLIFLCPDILSKLVIRVLDGVGACHDIGHHRLSTCALFSLLMKSYFQICASGGLNVLYTYMIVLFFVYSDEHIFD